MTAGSQGRGSHPARPRGMQGDARSGAPPPARPAANRPRRARGSPEDSRGGSARPRRLRPAPAPRGGAPGPGAGAAAPPRRIRGVPATGGPEPGKRAGPPARGLPRSPVAPGFPRGGGRTAPSIPAAGRGRLAEPPARRRRGTERSGAGTRLPGRLREGEARSPTGAGPREPARSSHRGRPAEALREPEPRRGTGRLSAQARGAPGEHGEPGPAGARQPARSVPPHRADREEPRPRGERRPRSPTPAASPLAPTPLEPEPSRRGHRYTEPGRGPASRRDWRRPCPQLAPGLRAAATLGGSGGRPELRG